MVSLGVGINYNGFIRGLVGSLVDRKVGNKNYLQSSPYRVKQTDDTKRAVKDFGKVSRAGALIRTCFGQSTRISMMDRWAIGSMGRSTGQ